MSDRREFIGTYEHMGGTTYSIDVQWAILGEAEEIVRCRDCKCSSNDGTSCWLNPECVTVEPDGFCAWGGRK